MSSSRTLQKERLEQAKFNVDCDVVVTHGDRLVSNIDGGALRCSLCTVHCCCVIVEWELDREAIVNHVIEHFMWGFQPHFRINQEIHARAVFQLLDKSFNPEVFLVGVRTEDRPDRHAACVEPECDFWIPSDVFDSVVEAAGTISPTYPESRLLHSDPRVQESEAGRLQRRAIRETISRVIAEHPTKPKRITYFVSFPVQLDAYLVSTVLGLEEEVINSHARLLVDRAQVHPYRSFETAVSLIHATIDEFLKDSATSLGRPNAGEGFDSVRPPAEVLRLAAARLTRDCAYKADSNVGAIGGWQALFDTCNFVSSLDYERAASHGRLILSRHQHPAVETSIAFAVPVELAKFRRFRKLLELTSHGLGLHVNAKLAFGLAQVRGYSKVDEDLYEVEFLGRNRWTLAHAGRTLMHVDSGQPQLPAPPFDSARLHTDLRRVFRELSPADTDRLVALVETAITETHGTTLVVVEDAAQEALRLASQGTPIEPKLATPSMMKHITPIDGAVLLAPDGVCHAIGVILDGSATPHGDPSRGARFNSALRYVEEHERACVAIVVSVDGQIDLIPDMHPCIRRSLLDEKIADLAALETSIQRPRFNKLVGWIRQHAFYLLPEHCEQISPLIERIEKRLTQETGTHFVQRPFTPDQNFDPELYYEDE